MRMPLPALKLIFGATALVCGFIGTAYCGQISAGGFSFSDELGGFRLISVTGKGTVDEPFVIVEEIFDGLPAILTIRRQVGFSERPSWVPGAGSKLFRIKKIVRNLTNRPWTGFDVELRQILDKPSTYDDGLSFNQVTRNKSDVLSDKFAEHHRRYEPRDSIHFERGQVEPGTQLQLSLPISDTTPIGEFYLMQEPIFQSVASNRAMNVPIAAVQFYQAINLKIH